MQSVSTQLQQEIARILKQEIGMKNFGVHVVIENIIGYIKAKAVNDGSLCTASIASSSDYSLFCCPGGGDSSENTCCTNHTEYP
jgi:hypothetical protein